MFGFRLRVPASGDDITADWARELVKAVRSLRLHAGPGIRLTRTPEGTTVSTSGADGRTAAPVGLAEVDVGTVAASSTWRFGRFSVTTSNGESYALDVAETALTAGLPGGARIIVHPTMARIAAGGTGAPVEQEEE